MINKEPIICNICGKICHPRESVYPKEYLKKHNLEDNYEFSTLQATWGYFSDNKDLTQWECFICEKCSEKVEEFIKSLGGKIRKYYYDVWNGDRLEEINE